MKSEGDRMMRGIGLLTTVYLLFAPASIWANVCHALFTPTNNNTPAQVAQLLADAGSINHGSIASLTQFSSFLIETMKPELLQVWIERLSLNYRHRVKRAIITTVLIPSSHPNHEGWEISVLKSFPPALFTQTLFTDLVNLARDQRQYQVFSETLKETLANVKLVRDNALPIDQSLGSILAGLEALEDPLLVGHFMAIFLVANAETRLALLDLGLEPITDSKGIPNSLALKGSSKLNLYAIGEALATLLESDKASKLEGQLIPGKEPQYPSP